MPKAAPKSTASSRSAPYFKSTPRPKSPIENKENANPNTTPPSNSASDYRSIQLDIKKGEVPCYDNAATIRRKLNKLLIDKSTIPGTTKKWNKTTMAHEMEELEKRDGAPEMANPNSCGPSVSSISTFLKKSGNMGGGDSDSYYWGYVLLEKLRMHNGEKKSKPRLESEKQRPLGYKRWDPKQYRKHMICGQGFPPPDLTEMANAGRSEINPYSNYI